MSNVNIKRIAPLFVILGASLWGVDGIVLRPLLFSLPVPLVVFVESALVALLLTPIFYRKFQSLKNFQSGDWLAFLGVAILGGAIGTMAITRALFYVNFVNLSIVILIQKLQPAFAIVLAHLFLKEKPSREFYIWAGIAVIGAYFLTFGMNPPDIYAGGKTALAALFAIVAALSFAASTVLSKRALKNIDFRMGTYLRFGLTAIIMLLIAGSTGDLSATGEISSNQWFIFCIIAFTSGGTAIFLYYYGLKEISASVATICELAFPLTAVLLEYILRGNFLGWFQLAGAAILILSITRVSILNTKTTSA
ncbi:MAG: DMT family transporter [Calditrichales bacterium]|nr:MAG: DMT family transporter [Calditrichales bacterium]